MFEVVKQCKGASRGVIGATLQRGQAGVRIIYPLTRPRLHSNYATWLISGVRANASPNPTRGILVRRGTSTHAAALSRHLQ